MKNGSLLSRKMSGLRHLSNIAADSMDNQRGLYRLILLPSRIRISLVKIGDYGNGGRPSSLRNSFRCISLLITGINKGWDCFRILLMAMKSRGAKRTGPQFIGDCV